MTKVRIVFLGTPSFAIPVLKGLLDGKYDVVAVFTGNGPIEFEARKHGIKVFTPTSLKKDDEIFETFKLLNPDVCVMAAYGKILPPRYLEIPKYGFLNIHPSLLPKYRGPSPIQTAILNGDKEIGIAVTLVDAEVDHGPLLASREFSISNFQFSNHNELAKKLFELGAKLLIETLPKYINGEIEVKPQEHEKATFTKMFSREDGRINWNNSAQEIYNRIRALNPEPGTWTTWQGKVINIPTCEVGYPQMVDLTPGTVKKVDHKIAVATSAGYLTFESIQLEGGKEMDAKSFVNGHLDFIGSQLK